MSLFLYLYYLVQYLFSILEDLGWWPSLKPGCGTQADLESAGAFVEPIKGCRYVLHTASPVIMAPPKGKVRHAVQISSCSEGRLAHPLKLLICSWHTESVSMPALKVCTHLAVVASSGLSERGNGCTRG